MSPLGAHFFNLPIFARYQCLRPHITLPITLQHKRKTLILFFHRDLQFKHKIGRVGILFHDQRGGSLERPIYYLYFLEIDGILPHILVRFPSYFKHDPMVEQYQVEQEKGDEDLSGRDKIVLRLGKRSVF